jgi:hypothetical protein
MTNGLLRLDSATRLTRSRRTQAPGVANTRGGRV